jgi:hypothetical protein
MSSGTAAAMAAESTPGTSRTRSSSRAANSRAAAGPMLRPL